MNYMVVIYTLRVQPAQYVLLRVVILLLVKFGITVTISAVNLFGLS